ncbi:MAG: hypothetical protein DRQ10_00725 [Candidatus Hydrothermota bacterium]|nr:MAG: hypothetical protein DRQ10_00725 [Candidatus Hydrothermae bacterium]
MLDPRIKRGIKITVLSFTAVSLLLLAFTIDRRTFETLGHFNLEYFPIVVLLWFAYRFSDGMVIKSVAKLLGHNLSPLKTFQIVLVGVFLAAVTPFQISSIPVQIYMLHREGLDVGKATAVIVARGALFYLALLPLLPFIVYSLGISSNFIGKILVGYFTFTILTVFILYFISVSRPDLILKLIPQKLAKVKVFVLQETANLREGIKVLLQSKDTLWVSLSLMFSITSIILLGATAPFILKGLNLPPQPFRSMPALILMYSSMLYTPTPGGVGVAETIAAALFSPVCPKHLMGIFIILLRIFTYYLGALVGGIIFFHQSFTIEQIDKTDRSSFDVSAD